MANSRLRQDQSRNDDGPHPSQGEGRPKILLNAGQSCRWKAFGGAIGERALGDRMRRSALGRSRESAERGCHSSVQDQLKQIPIAANGWVLPERTGPTMAWLRRAQPHSHCAKRTYAEASI